MQDRNSRFPPPPSLTLSDALIVILAIALGLAHVKLYHSALVRGPRSLYYFTIGRLNYRQWAVFAVPLLLPIAPALVVLRLRRPWRPLRRTISEPGCSAAIVSTLLWVMHLTMMPLVAKLPSPPFTSRLGGVRSPVAITSFALSASLGPAVVAAWAGQGLSGRWKPRATWIDRAGRFLGFFFIDAYLIREWLRIHL